MNIKIYRTIILPFVLCGCETWSLTLREERRLRVFENKVLRRIFGPKWDEVTGEWRKLHNEELNDLNCPSNLRAGRSGNRIPVGARFSAPVQTGPGPTQPPLQWVPALFTGG
jgi:hypothetical protein